MTVGANNGAGTFSGVIQNTSGTILLTKTGTGIQTFTGTNTYTGGTNVTAGNLFVTNTSGSGTGSGLVTVTNGVLGGTGTISGAVSISSTGSLAPGIGAPGKLTINNSVTFASGTTFAVDINGTTAGASYDQLATNSAVTLGNATLAVMLGAAPVGQQVYTIISGASSISGTFNGLTQGATVSYSYSGTPYMFIVSYTGGTGHDVTLTACSGSTPVITTQPSNTQVYNGDTATFTVSAGTGVSYQWQRGTNNGTIWSNVAVGIGGTSATYKFQTSIGLDSNTQFRCIVSACGSVTSNPALLLVCNRTVITTQPVNATGVNLGDSATFTIVATGSGPTYQWQRLRLNGSWTAITGQTSTTCRVKVDSVDTSSKYQCVVTGAVACGSSIVNSNTVTVQVCFPPVITAQPVSQAIVDSQHVSFSVVASGKGALTYQWQRAENGSSAWGNITSATSSTYGFTAYSTDSGAKFQCIVSSTPCGSTTSATATIITCALPAVTADPSSQTVIIGDSAWFSVAATNVLGYQWQRSIDKGISWTNVPGATTLSYDFLTTASDTVQVRCIVSGGCGGFDTSMAALLTLCTAVGITAQPATQSVASGAGVTFSVVAVGTSLSYQWQREENGGSTWNPIALANTASYTFTAAVPSTGNVSPDSGAQFRCMVTSTCGGTLSSNAAIANVNTTPIITKNPSDTSVTVGNTAVFSVQARGTITSYQWQRTNNAGTSWSPVSVGTGGTTAVYSFTTTISDTVTGVQFRCVVTGPSGSATSGIARIGLCFPVAIQTNPQSDTVTSGNQATFFVGATGSGLTYQWEKDTAGTGAWVQIAQATNATYGFNVVSANNNWRFHCIVSSTPCGTPATSGVAVLTVCTPVAITANPRDTIITSGANAVFSVTATGTMPAYKWQKSQNGGSTWMDVTGTTANCTVSADTADTGALFHCVVTGSCGTATSTAAKLTICFPLTIPAVGQPADQLNIAPGQQAIFHVRPSGLRLSYQWQRSADGTTWTALPNQTGNDYSFLVGAADNNVKFRCSVWDTCTTVISTAATLTVCAAPVVVVQPDSPGVIENQRAQFTISATGTNPKYQWQRMNRGGSTWDSLPGATDTVYTIDSAKMADSGARFRCRVTGQCGSVLSMDAKLTVYVKAKASFSMFIDGRADSIGPAPDTVRLTDLSSGAVSTWTWSFGDGKGKTDSTPGVIRDYVYNGIGTDTVKLIVQGPGGTDSMSRILTVYSKTGNPILMTGRYLPADSSVMLSFKNYDSLHAAPAAPPTVDSIMLWYQIGSLPDTTGDAKFLKSYLLSTIKANGSVYSDKVKIDMAGTSLAACGFMTQIVWNDGRTTPFAPLNGYVVVMRDTLRPVNGLAVSGIYAPWDTVTFSLTNVQSIDSSSDSVGLWYGVGADSVPVFVNSTNPDLQWWNADSVRNAPGNRFTYVKKSGQFNTDTSVLHFAVVIRGKNKLFSDTLQSKINIGRVRPSNPIHLYAKADTGASSVINLTWNRYTAADSVEQIRIYYRTGVAIDTGRYDFTGLGLDSLPLVTPLNLGDTARPAKGLNSQTRYYFAAQVYKKGMWSVVTAASRATDSTVQAGASTIVNTVKVTSATFDSAANQVRVSWILDTAGMADLLIGYSYSITAGNPQSSAVKSVGNLLTSDTGSMVFNLGDSLQFNTTYYVYLWLKKEGEQWTAPTAASTDTLHTPAFVWQAVHADFTVTGDTLYWVNGKVMFVTPKVTATNVVTMTATIQAFADTVTNYAGFINVGQSFGLTQIKKQQELEIGLKTTLPAGWKLNDVLVYRFNAAVGKWYVDTSTQRDTANGYVYVLTNQLDMPFAALIDTMRPFVKVVDMSTAPVKKNDTVNYTVQVSDNVGNLMWSFQSTKGGDPYSRGNSVGKTLTNGIDTARVSIDTGLVGDENGVLARFICFDGRFSDTIDLSRQVVRQISDAGVTTALNWVPLRVTGVLDSPQAKRLLHFVDTTAVPPKYDDRYVRLFRRYPYASNIGEKNRWLEYTNAPDSVFDFVSGRLMWIKTRASVKLDFGRAVTMPQTVPVTVPLFAHEWTDFALPYRYNMHVGDIIAATRDSGSYADSIQIYGWFTGKNGLYTTQTFYLRNVQDNPATVMSYVGDTVGFSVFNQTGRVVKLVIPPISEFMSAYTDTSVKAKKASDTGNNRWAIKVLPKTADGSMLTSVYCGYSANRSEGKTFYPVAPSFATAGVCVYDDKSGMICGHKIVSDMSGGGCSYLLMFSNGSATAQAVSFTLERTGAFPSAMTTASFNPFTGETVAVGSGALSVPIDGEGSEYRWLFVGDAQYILSAARAHASAKLALTSVYPNPVRRFAHLLYTLPFGKVASVDFTVLDIMGRTIWHKNIKETSILGGRRDYVWYGTAANGRRVAAGVYVLTMTANDAKNRPAGIFDRRLTVLP